MDISKDKVCKRCKTLLSIDNFYKNVARPDKLFSYCKVCCIEINGRQKLRAKCLRLWSARRGDRTAQSKRYYARYPERVKAYNKVIYNLKRGKLIKPTECSKCNKRGRVIAHHDDYTKPLEVIWLCEDCHNKVHGRITKYRLETLTV